MAGGVPVLGVRLLGTFALFRADQEVPAGALRDATSRALLKYLLLHRGRVVAQDVLAELFWPDSGPPAARASLHAAISHLRRVLEPDLDRPARSRLILSRFPGYVCQTGSDICRVDLDQYTEWASAAEARAAAGDWHGVVQAAAAAEALVSGELLACEPYADWAEPARREFRRRRAELLELALVGHERLQHWEAAIATARRALALDPVREGFYRHLMTAYAAAGEPALALRVFDECRRVLAEELGTEPSPATVAVHAGILGPRTAPPPAAGVESLHRSAVGALTLPLIGRERWLERLPPRLRAGDMVVMTGDPGVGKSRLAAELLSRMAAEGARVLAAECRPLERRPYQALAEALGALWPGGTAPESDEGHLARGQERLFGLAAGRLMELAAAAPVVLFLDDLHWADPDTLNFLTYLQRRAAGPTVAILTAVRTAEGAANPVLGSLLARARRLGRLVEVPVEVLSGSDMVRLVAWCAAEPRERVQDLAGQLFRESGGNPLFAVERLRDLLESGELQPGPDGRWRWRPDLDLSGRPLPAVALDLARERTARLAEPARQLLHAAVVLGTPAPFAWLAAVAEGEPAALLEGLDQLLERRLLVEQRTAGGEVYDVIHHLIREAVYRSLSGARRTHLHRRAGAALARLAQGEPPPPALVAHHWLSGGDAASALAWFRRAGAAARAALALDDAAAHLERALRLAEQLGQTSEVARCSEELADVLRIRGQYGRRVTDLYQCALEHAATGGDRARLCLGLARAYLETDNAAALEWAERALGLAQAAGRRELIGPALVCQSVAQHLAARYAAALALGQAALDAFRASGDVAGEANCYLDLAGTYMQLGRLEEQRRSILTGLSLCDAIGDTYGRVDGRLRLSEAAAIAARWREAEEWARSALELAEPAGMMHRAAWARLSLGWALYRLGRLESAATALEQAMAEADMFEARRLAVDARLFLSLVMADLGERDRAAALSAEALSRAESLAEPQFAVIAAAARAYVLWMSGDAPAALAAARQGLAAGQGRTHNALVYVYSILGEVQAELGDARAALATAEQLLAAARGIGLPLEEAIALRIQGRALAQLGQGAAAAAALSGAVERLEQLEAAVELRRTRELVRTLRSEWN